LHGKDLPDVDIDVSWLFNVPREKLQSHMLEWSKHTNACYQSRIKNSKALMPLLKNIEFGGDVHVESRVEEVTDKMGIASEVEVYTMKISFTFYTTSEKTQGIRVLHDQVARKTLGDDEWKEFIYTVSLVPATRHESQEERKILFDIKFFTKGDASMNGEAEEVSNTHVDECRAALDAHKQASAARHELEQHKTLYALQKEVHSVVMWSGELGSSASFDEEDALMASQDEATTKCFAALADSKIKDARIETSHDKLMNAFEIDTFASKEVAEWSCDELGIPQDPTSWRTMSDFILLSCDSISPRPPAWETLHSVLEDIVSLAWNGNALDDTQSALVHQKAIEMGSATGYCFVVAAAEAALRAGEALESDPAMVALAECVFSTQTMRCSCQACDTLVAPLVRPTALGPISEEWVRLLLRRCPTHWAHLYFGATEPPRSVARPS